MLGAGSYTAAFRSVAFTKKSLNVYVYGRFLCLLAPKFMTFIPTAPAIIAVFLTFTTA